jgi:hypothetical protein
MSTSQWWLSHGVEDKERELEVNVFVVDAVERHTKEMKEELEKERETYKRNERRIRKREIKVVPFVWRIGEFDVYSGILGLGFVRFAWKYMGFCDCG